MKHHTQAALTATLILCVTLAFGARETVAQTMKSVAGTYTAVTVPAFGDNPLGTLILTPDGHYSIIITRAMMPKIAAGTRTGGTAEENKAVVEGSLAHAGRYTIDDAGKAITLHIETATFPNWNSTTQKRPLKVSGDTLTYTVTTPSTGGAPNEVVWKRVK